jgi:hypothetical protein
VGRWLRLGRAGPSGKKEKGGRRVGRGPDGEGKGVWGLVFFQTLFNSNLLHKFLQTFHKPFSQLFLKTFKATQQQSHAFQHDAQTLGYFLN